ncbi:hypothetical protein [Hymenobacter gelipurpurascens]|uniref:hypothetical protein n=1 Tax=Hymenobacter gelipurpurascens TaxID=89968 RepID=UPI00113185ED|nr:hypothetical protein [Hymenobacter gelipurpurascens]
MKTLLRLFLLVTLVVIGKLSKEDSAFPASAAKSAQSVLQAPVRSASLFFGQAVPKTSTNLGHEYQWHATSTSLN